MERITDAIQKYTPGYNIRLVCMNIIYEHDIQSKDGTHEVPTAQKHRIVYM